MPEMPEENLYELVKQKSRCILCSRVVTLRIVCNCFWSWNPICVRICLIVSILTTTLPTSGATHHFPLPQILHILFSYFCQEIYQFQLHTIVDRAYIENVSRNPITFVFVFNYVTYMQVHRCNDGTSRKQQSRCTGNQSFIPSWLLSILNL